MRLLRRGHSSLAETTGGHGAAHQEMLTPEAENHRKVAGMDLGPQAGAMVGRCGAGSITDSMNSPYEILTCNEIWNCDTDTLSHRAIILRRDEQFFSACDPQRKGAWCSDGFQILPN